MFAKLAAEQIVDDLDENEDAARSRAKRRKMLLALAALGGLGGLGYLAYRKGPELMQADGITGGGMRVANSTAALSGASTAAVLPAVLGRVPGITPESHRTLKGNAPAEALLNRLSAHDPDKGISPTYKPAWFTRFIRGEYDTERVEAAKRLRESTVEGLSVLPKPGTFINDLADDIRTKPALTVGDVVKEQARLAGDTSKWNTPAMSALNRQRLADLERVNQGAFRPTAGNIAGRGAVGALAGLGAKWVGDLTGWTQ